VDVRQSWSDGKVEHAPAGAELFHTGASRRTSRRRELRRYRLASDEEIRAFAVEAPFVEQEITAEVAYLRLSLPRSSDSRLQPAGEPC
jgi:hypothetical protein